MNDIDQRYLDIINKLNSLGENDEVPADLFDSLTQREIIAIYVEQMLMDKGVDGITNAMRMDLIEKLNRKISENVINALPEETLMKYSAEQLNNLSDEDLEKIMADAGVDVALITEKTMNDFREEFLNGGEQ